MSNVFYGSYISLRGTFSVKNDGGKIKLWLSNNPRGAKYIYQAQCPNCLPENLRESETAKSHIKKDAPVFLGNF